MYPKQVRDAYMCGLRAVRVILLTSGYTFSDSIFLFKCGERKSLLSLRSILATAVNSCINCLNMELLSDLNNYFFRRVVG